MKLSDIFTHVAQKELAQVDLPGRGSNQHEIDGVKPLRDFFDHGVVRQDILWFYFTDDETLFEEGNITFYDARANHPTRTEWRLYYTGDFLANAQPGDKLVLARTKANKLYGLVFSHKSVLYRNASILFDFQSTVGQFSLFAEQDLRRTDLEYLMKYILAALGLDNLIPVEMTDIELFMSKFGEQLPDTRTLSDYARQQVEVDPLADVDMILLQWLEKEESLFKAWEHLTVERKLRCGFSDVDEFIQYSLTVQNRRKSRMGQSLENHLEEIFNRHELKYTRNPSIEGGKRPDFLFPGKAEYEDLSFSNSLLDMLGVKSTCKDRWRQILNEASRIKIKHLFTLEQGISSNQTTEMQSSGVVLVVPKPFHRSYRQEQLDSIHSLGSFITYVKKKQHPYRNT